jgi:undecaprenyl-diphosphatase
MIAAVMSDVKVNEVRPDDRQRRVRSAGFGPAGVLGRLPWRLIGLLVAARIIYLLLLCPYELAADEAHYWEWSRRPALSYYSKGPGVAWVIAGSTGLLGDTESGVRLPAALSHGLAMVGLAGLGLAFVGDRRAGFYAAALWALTPAFWAMGQFMTIDMPFVACWALACWVGWHALVASSPQAGRSVSDSIEPSAHKAHHAWSMFGPWLALGLVLGVGFLFKYTILLLVPGLIGFAATRRWRRRHLRLIGPLLCLLVFMIACLPVIIWNAAHGWPTVSHLLGHLHAPGGDIAPRQWSYNPLWTLNMLGVQLGAIGPPIVVLAVLSLVRRHDKERIGLAEASPEGTPGRHGAAMSYALWCAAPIFLFYLVVSFITDVEGNWPLPGWVTLIGLAGAALPGALDQYRQRVAAWLNRPEPRPRAGFFRAKPETAMQVAWHWAIGWGVVGAVLISLGGWVVHLPGGDRLPGADRITGHRDRALQIHRAAEQLARRTGRRPLIIADNYRKASWLAFYLPDQPTVYCASRSMGGRASQYDHFEDTHLASALFTKNSHDRPAIFVDASAARWHNVAVVDRLWPIADADALFATERLIRLRPVDQARARNRNPPNE